LNADHTDDANFPWPAAPRGAAGVRAGTDKKSARIRVIRVIRVQSFLKTARQRRLLQFASNLSIPLARLAARCNAVTFFCNAENNLPQNGFYATNIKGKSRVSL